MARLRASAAGRLLAAISGLGTSFASPPATSVETQVGEASLLREPDHRHVVRLLHMPWLLNVGVLVSYVVLFLPWNRGFLVYGDFATSFAYSRQSFLTYFRFSWLDNSFLGFNTTLTTVPRIPLYAVLDAISRIFGPGRYWLAIVLAYFLRYLFTEQLLRFLGTRDLEARLLAFGYSCSFFFVDRLGAVLISFASVAVPLLIRYYLEAIGRVTWKSAVLISFATLWLMIDPQVTLMVLYLAPTLIIWGYLRERAHSSVWRWCGRHAVLLLFVLPAVAMTIMAGAVSVLVLHSQNIISQVGSTYSGGISYYSTTSVLPGTLLGLGYVYSPLPHGWALVIAAFVLVGGMYLILLVPNRPNDGIFYLIASSFMLFVALESFDVTGSLIQELKRALPGYSAVTDMSYFGLVTSLLFTLLLARAIARPPSSRQVQIIVAALVALLTLNFVTVWRAPGFKPVKIPTPYYALDSYLLGAHAQRIFLWPPDWGTRFSWSSGEMSGFFNVFLGNEDIVGQTILEGPPVATQAFIGGLDSCVASDCAALDSLLRQSGIDYIVVVNGAEDPASGAPIGQPVAFSDLALKGELTFVTGSPDYSVFRVKEAEGIVHAVGGEATFARLNPTEYIVEVQHLNAVSAMEFAESYDPGWRLAPLPIGLADRCLDGSQSVTASGSCGDELDLSGAGAVKNIVRTAAFGSSHFVANGYANGWRLSKSTILKTFPRDSYRVNRDGSLDVAMTLYFLPQAYVTLGEAMSACTFLIGLTGMAVADGRRRWSRRRRAGSS
jgi:hypothetical protein